MIKDNERNSDFGKTSAWLRLLAVTLLALSLPGVIHAQEVTNGLNIGFPENGVFHGSSFDNVQLNNGNLHIEIPLWSTPGRGLPVAFRYIYDSAGWRYDTHCVYHGSYCVDTVKPAPGSSLALRVASNVGGGVTWKLVTQQCSFVSYFTYINYVFQEPDGTKHHFFPDPAIPGGNSCWGPLGTDMYADDGSGFKLEVDTNNGVPIKVTRKDGTTVVSGALQDRNGNYVVFPVNPADTLGRTIPSQAPQPSYYDAGGNLQTIQVTYQNVTVQTALCQFSGADECNEYSNTWNVPQVITLPNGLSYTFTYAQNAYAQPLSVTLPTGGQISWSWTPPTSITGVTVQTRTVTEGSASRQWTYTMTTVPPTGSTRYVIVRNPVGDEVKHTFEMKGAGYSGWYYTTGSSLYYETKVEYFQGTVAGGQILKTVITDYNSGFQSGAVRPIRETTTWNQTNLVTKVETDWDTFSTWSGLATWRNPIERREYAYGTGAPGGLVRRTTYNYLHLTNPTYRNLNIADRVTSQTVYDGAGVVKAQATTTYDGSAPLVAPNAPNHDYTNFGTGYLTRGNPTSVSRWLSTTGTWLTTTNVYDELGNLRSTTDPGGHITTYSYSDDWANAGCVPGGVNTQAYVTQTTNHLGHRVQSRYFPCTGLTQRTRDENDILASREGTVFTYDFMNRPDFVTDAGGGQTDYIYETSPIRVTTKKLHSAGSWIVSRASVDDLGRIWRTELCEDGSEACTLSTKTDTIFDALDRTWKVTNPYRTTGDSTYGITETLYDALDRITKVIPPDGTAASNNVTTSYSANSVTVTDQAGKQRRSFTDALGRLVQVDEPGPSGGGSPATPGTGSANVTGSLQSVGGTSATPGTGSATVSGSLQTIPGTSATRGTGSVAISGSVRRKRDWDSCEFPQVCYIYDSGTVTITVNGFAAVAYYGEGSDANWIATSLANIFNTNPSSPVTATVTTSTVFLTSKVTGAASNYPLSASTTYDSGNFLGPSFTVTPSGATLTGGSNGTPTVYDSGSVRVTVNGLTKSVSYGQGSTSSSLASALASAINADGSYPVSATLNGTTVNLTAKTSGASTNYSLSGSSSTNQPGSFSQPSFAVAVSGATLTGGSNGIPTVYDSGNVWVTVNGLTKTVSYGQGSTSSSVASALASAINADSGYPVTASLSGSTINLTAKTAGASTNYSLVGGSSTGQPGTFAGPSFYVGLSGSTLTGGADAVPVTYSLSTPAVTTYTYDTLDNLLTVLQSGSRQRTFVYDSLSRLTSATNPESGIITYAYDTDGNLTGKTAPKPNQTNPAVTVTTNFQYDALHRLLRKWYTGDSTTPEVNTFYDGVAPSVSGCTPSLTATNPIGRRTAMCDGAGFSAWAYDEMGAVLAEQRKTNGVTRQTNYDYNEDGSVKFIQYPSGALQVNYAYDAAGRALSAVQNGGGANFASAALYAPHGALVSLQNGASIFSTYYYNNRLQPCRISVRSAGILPANCFDAANIGNVLDFTYGFDSDPAAGVQNNGNVGSIANNRNSNRSQSFSYDALNRIATAKTQATSGQYCWGETFGYDVWANLLSIGAVTGYTGCTQENLSVSATTKNQISGSTYDAAGNLTSAPGMGSYTYDAENRMTATAGVAYTYDGDGRRVKKSNGKLYWYGAGSDALAETDLAGNNATEYVFFGGKRIARRDPSGAAFYYFADHLGSSRVVTNATGGIVEDSDYYPFGGERIVVNNDPNPYKFTGKERDTESSLDYFGARHYSSAQGRFLSPDEFTGGPVDAFSSSDPLPPGPLPYADITNPQSLNKYTYTYNNPLRYTDPNGHGVVDFLLGVANSWGSNNFAGAGRNTERTDQDFKDGQALGDAISVVQGGVELLLGSGVEVGGLALDATGVGAVVGVPANIAGAAVIAHGAGTAASGAANLGRRASESIEAPAEARSTPKEGSAGGPSAGKRATPKQRERALQENNGKCVFCGKKATQVDHAKARSRGGNTTKKNLQGTCEHCNKQKGAKSTNEYLDWKKEQKKKE